MHSFPRVGRTLGDWERILADSPHGGIETLWVGELGGRIVAGCRLLRFRQWIAGAELPVMGLSTVAISATHRRRGIAAALTSSALAAARGRGDVGTALYPFRESFYRRLGYGRAGEAYQYILPPAAFPDHREGRQGVELIRLPEETESLASVYDHWIRTQSGQMSRSPAAWRAIAERDDLRAVVCRDEAGEPRGYAMFRYSTERIQGRTLLEIEEIAWLDRSARLGLYGWLASLSDQWGLVAYRAHPEEYLAEHLSELKHPSAAGRPWQLWFPAATLLYGPMFRLVDLETAWSARTVRRGQPTTVRVVVRDPQLPENDGRWRFHFENGRTSVTREEGEADGELSLTIEMLSRIYIGAITVSGAVESGLASLDATDPEMAARLDSLLSTQKPWTFDRF